MQLPGLHYIKLLYLVTGYITTRIFHIIQSYTTQQCNQITQPVSAYCKPLPGFLFLITIREIL